MKHKSEQLKKILDEIWKLKESPLYAYRKANNYYPVIGEGNHDTKIMFIGEAPGKNEAEQGRPFVGAAGKILVELLAHIGLAREDVYISNIVKDRPPENRDPTGEEIELYAPFLDRQIAIIQPAVIATLGRFSMSYLLTRYNAPEKDQSISKLHGSVIPISDDFGEVSLVPLYHPAVALYNANQKTTLKKDFEVLKQFLS
ncbi:MAG: uracil-DNA glycosylase [Candidatus Roizmanbacteria bacterium]|nr:uracil-DNA glycosylase [Candidatus Roizmanbacteria bacterium]